MPEVIENSHMMREKRRTQNLTGQERNSHKMTRRDRMWKERKGTTRI